MTLELILWFPIMVIMVMAVVEFAIILQVDKNVAHASRYGAKLASEITRNQAAATNLGNFNQTATANNLKSRIDTYLANAGLTASCQVLFEHSACAPNTTQNDPAAPSANCPCGASPTTLAADETVNPFTNEGYVKVTVCVPLSGNVPNVLSTFGFDTANKTIEHSTVMRLETNNTAPNAVIQAASINAMGISGLSSNVPTTGNVTVTVPNGTANSATYSITFNSNSSTDTESPFGDLTFNWQVINGGATPTTGTGSTFTVTFTVPGTIGGGQSTRDNFVRLTVTDPCNDTNTRQIRVRTIRQSI